MKTKVPIEIVVIHKNEKDYESLLEVINEAVIWASSYSGKVLEVKIGVGEELE